MTDHPWFHELDVPRELPGPLYDAIRTHVERLHVAVDRRDWSDAVGKAKELAECVARVVLEIHGKTPASNLDYGPLIDAAHRAIGLQTGEGLATGGPVATIIGSMRKVVGTLGDLRNGVGTGHGRAVNPAVVEEHATVAVDAVFAWCRWVLRRLPTYLLADVDVLIDLLRGGTFYRGDLRERLDAVGLRTLDPDVARRLGAAVARRSMRETFLVHIEGVRWAVGNTDAAPNPFRSGLIDGVLIDVDGNLSTTEQGVDDAIALLCVDEHAADTVSALAPIIRDAHWVERPHVYSPPLADIARMAIDRAGPLPADARASWINAWSTRMPASDGPARSLD